MRFWIEVVRARGAGVNAWDVSVRCAAWQEVRRMPRIEFDDGVSARAYPGAEECEQGALPGHQLCVCRDVKALNAAYERLVNRNAASDAGEVRQFGEYLFNALLGETLWDRILKEAGSSDEVELALSWSADESDLHRFNWELMRARAGALASGRVGFTRVVKDTMREAKQILAPPRLLFVVGTDMYDKRIQPGAECLGLLQEVKERSAGWSLYSRVLLDASKNRVEALALEFKPDIVHFITHGRVNPISGNTELWLQLDPTQQPQDESQHWFTGEQLLACLEAGGSFPALVVLSACETGGMMGGHQTGVLAAELVKGNVRGGIPVVIGMAGRVADTACRFFTQRFTAALISGDPLWKAAAEGRAAAFAGGTDPGASADWAFPVIYMASDTPEDYTPVLMTQLTDAQREQRWIGSYDSEYDPIFCNRDHCFAAYYEMWKPGGAPVLAVAGEQGFGKTRLLGELAARAIRNGHVPVLLTGVPCPTIKDICSGLSVAVSKAYEYHGLLPPDTGSLPQLTEYLTLSDQSVLTGAIRRAWVQAQQRVSGRVLRLAVQEDLYALAAAVQAKYPRLDGKAREPLLLLDDLQEYDAKVLNDLFYDGGLNDLGMGRREGDVERPVRVIVAFVTRDTDETTSNPADGILRPIARRTDRSRSWLDVVWLRPFSDKEDNGRVAEDRLIYERVMLHPPELRTPASDVVEEISYKPLIVNPKSDPKTISQWMDFLRDAAKGQPSQLSRKPGQQFWFVVNMAYKLDAFIEADFNEMLKQVSQLRLT